MTDYCGTSIQGHTSALITVERRYKDIHHYWLLWNVDTRTQFSTDYCGKSIQGHTSALTTVERRYKDIRRH